MEASPGADDNASGIAVYLELARILEPIKFNRTVQFVAVNLEERQRDRPLEIAGLFGSRVFATEAKQQGWKIKGVIVFDAIAYAGEQLLQEKPQERTMNYPGKGNFIAIVANAASSELVKLFTQAIQEHQLPLPMVPVVVSGNGEILPDTRRSDHSSFWDKGYSAVWLTDTANFRNPHYHQASDTIDTINPLFVTQVCRAVAWTTIEAANSRYSPTLVLEKI